MKITVHRGSNQIGGCVTEYEWKGWKLFVDYGEQLPGTPVTDKPFVVEGLNAGDVSRSLLLITHYHGDHIGKIPDLPAGLPIYMGALARDLTKEFAEYMSNFSENHARLSERLVTVKTFRPGEELTFGEFTIIPIVIDHSAFDAYAFRIQSGDGLKVFHTGDFRTHGFRSAKLSQVIDKYVGKVDYVVCEATNVNRPDATQLPEYELQTRYQRAFEGNKFNVVYLSSTNIDRLFGLYHAAVRAGRPFFVDAFQRRIMDVVVNRNHTWGKSRLYKYCEGNEPIALQRAGREFKVTDKFKKKLQETGYVLAARANDRFGRLIARLPSSDRKVYLSMWQGYLDETQSAYNPRLVAALGEDYEYLHSSGHCDMESLEKLLTQLHPKGIIPIHTDNPRGFAEIFSDKWPVILLDDGESITPIRDPGYDDTVAMIIAYKHPDSNLKVIANPEGLPWWEIDQKSIGEFLRYDDAEYALRHTVYAPSRLLGCTIESDEDMAPWDYTVFNPDFTVYSEYVYGDHTPDGDNYRQSSGFNPGDKVLAAIYPMYNAIVPCEIVGPITVEFLKEGFEKQEINTSATFEEYIEELWDWDWDTVIVRPLVRLGNGHFQMDETIDVQRIYLFPPDVIRD